MITNTNMVVIQGGLVKDPEVYNEKVVQFSVAVDNAGSEKGVPNASGYFDVKVWLVPSKMSPEITAEAMSTALAEKTLRKGARVSVVGRLVHERWKGEDGKRASRVVVVADSFNVIYSGNKATTSDATTEAPALVSAGHMEEF